MNHEYFVGSQDPGKKGDLRTEGSRNRDKFSSFLRWQEAEDIEKKKQITTKVQRQKLPRQR